MYMDMAKDIVQYYTPEEVAKILKVHLNTIYNWLASGELKGCKVGDLWRIRREDLPKT